MKQLISKMLMLTAVLSVSANVLAYDFKVDGIYYNILSKDDKTVEVTYKEYSNGIYKSDCIGEVVIPEQVSYNNVTYSVTSIGNSAFSGCSMVSMSIPNSVTSIGDSAFSGCSSLKDLTIEDGEEVLSLGLNGRLDDWNGLFHYCPLETVYLGRDLSYIDTYRVGYSPFYETPIKKLIIGNSVTTIGNYAFYGCSGLASVTIPESVTTIGNSAFSGCSSLTSVTIPESVTTIGNSAFSGCSSLTSVTIPENVTSIGEYAFGDCSSLTSVTIPESVTTIGNYAFSGCSSLTSVTIPNSVTKIGDSAFKGCSSLTSVTIPENVISIGYDAFDYCSALKDLTIEDSVETLELEGYDFFYGCSLETVYLGRNLSYYATYPSGSGNSPFYETPIKKLIIGNSVTTIGNYAFYGCSGLASVAIGNSVTFIGNRAFAGCSSLTSVTIPESVTTIGNYAFSGCSSLTSVTIPESVTTIGNYAFSGCSSLTSVTIPNSVTSIGNYAFYNCSGLEKFTFENGEKVLVIGRDLFSDYSINTLYLGRNINCNESKSPFQNATIINLIIGNNVTSIGDWAFSSCSWLTSVTIPNSVTSIGNYAFSGCSGLTSVTIPESVTSIGGSAFRGCSGLVKAIWLPNTPPGGYRNLYDVVDINYVGNNSYHSADSNRQIYPLINSMEEINGIIYVPVEQTEFIYDIIGYIDSATSINIGEGLNIANIAPYAFYGYSGLISLTIPESVTIIGESAFSYCSGLTSVTIPDNVLSVGSSAFANSGVKELTIEDGEETISIGEDAFDSSPIATMYLGRNLSSFVFTNGMQYLKNLTISDNVTSSLGNFAFSGCESLETVMIPNSVTSIGQSAFNSCENLKSVTIGAGVLSIGESAFEGTELVKTVWLPNTPPDGYEDVKSKCNYVANESYTELSNQTVYPYLSSMFETGGLKYVPVSPSERTCDAIDCSYDNTADIVIGKTVNYKGIEMTLLDVKDYLCYNNDSIKTLSINEYGGRIGRRSFQYCTSLESIEIRNMADSIGDAAFYNCINLKTVDISGVGGNIGESAFYNCTGIETVSLSDIMGGIGSKAFYNCENLGGIEIPNTVTGIGNGCFQNGSSLAYAIIGMGVSELPENCFYGCSSLPEITIPATVEKVGNNVFYGCTTLARVDIEDRQSELSLGYNSDYSSSDQRPLFSDCPLDSVYIGGNISYATDSDRGYSPFYRNTSLRAVKITDQETEISENEFYGCTGLTTVELGDGIESIGNYAFSGCSALDSFSFGHSVTTIGEEAFSDCTAMTRLQSRTEVPPVCGNQALDDINKWTCELFVPAKSLDAYKAAEQWKEFFFITGEDLSGVEDVVLENDGVSVTTNRGCIEVIGADNAVITVYNTNGQIVYSGTDTVINVPSKGIYIVRVSGQTFKVIL